MDKQCSKCGVGFPRSGFCKDSKSSDDLQSQCKSCKNEWAKCYYRTHPQKRWDHQRDRREYRLEYYHNNKPSMNMARRMRQSLTKHKNRRHWEKLVDFTLDELQLQLESKFVDGMHWGNYGSIWHIDHIIPVSSFNITSCESVDFKRCWSLENLQPLFKEDNLRKSNKIIPR